MLIACPRCETTFSLPDELYRPGKKARCSQCALVFPMPEATPQQRTFGAEPAAEKPGGSSDSGASAFFKKHFKIFVAAAVLALLLFLGYGGYLIYSSLSSGAGSSVAEQAAGPAPAEDGQSPQDAEQAEYQRLVNSISLDKIRQFLVDNTRIGKIMVIQGVAVNISDSNKDYIGIEARILDANNRVLAKVEQLCGVPMTLFQLQSLSEAEIAETLQNRISILTNNTNVGPGMEVPFVVVFPKPPEQMRTFEVRVIGVSESPVP